MSYHTTKMVPTKSWPTWPTYPTHPSTRQCTNTIWIYQLEISSLTSFVYTVLQQSIEASKKIRELHKVKIVGHSCNGCHIMSNLNVDQKKLPSLLGVTYPMHNVHCTCAQWKTQHNYFHMSEPCLYRHFQTNPTDRMSNRRLSLSVSVRGCQRCSTFSTCSSSSLTCCPSPFHSMTIWFVCHNHCTMTLLLSLTLSVIASWTCLHPTQTGDGINGGLEANGPEFKVNGKPIRILSGSLHYFRFSIEFKAGSLYWASDTGCTQNIGKQDWDSTRFPLLLISNPKWPNTGCRPERCGRVCALEPARASKGWFWLWGGFLPVLTLPQHNTLPSAGQGGGPACYSQVIFTSDPCIHFVLWCLI